MRVLIAGLAFLGALTAPLLASCTTHNEPSKVLWRIPVPVDGKVRNIALKPGWLWLGTSQGVTLRDPVTTAALREWPLGRGQQILLSADDVQFQIDRKTWHIRAFDPLTEAVFWEETREREYVLGGGSGVLVTTQSLEGAPGKRQTRILGLDAHTGEERWSLTVPLRHDIVVGEQVLVAGGNGLVVADLKTGKVLHRSEVVVAPRWVAEGSAGEVWYAGGRPISYEGRPEDYWVFGRLTGSPLRENTGACAVDDVTWLEACGDTVFVMDFQGIVTGYDAASCEPRGQWATGISGSRMTAGKIGGRCALITHTGGNEVVALDVEDGFPPPRRVTVKGHVTWESRTPVLEAHATVNGQTVPIDNAGRFEVTVESAGFARVDVIGRTVHRLTRCSEVTSVALDQPRKDLEIHVQCFTHVGP